jgi:hypothetical protein
MFLLPTLELKYSVRRTSITSWAAMRACKHMVYDMLINSSSLGTCLWVSAGICTHEQQNMTTVYVCRAIAT